MVTLIQTSIIILAAFGVMWLVRKLAAKVFRIEETADTAAEYYEERSRQRTDSLLRDYSLVVLVVAVVIAVAYFNESFPMILITAYVLLAIRMLVKAYLEWKRSSHPKRAIYTVTDTIVLLGLVITLLQTGIVS
ncbi:DUF4181 domain-containing protein [Sporosarcina trichiuri]|uniref:DUF4181 domain-containing protein n=1 Tax=Sporosarcina trichiuri TaxID=3056445 RepID=UPI0025B5CF1D|nr:DUF4181 domain-containing protein [Sporosarcina sp. 0.2-SM1T-5]WJY27229.1 DUF4181 domain-containing protein [Sporosarcina sp. 0.2-SM1T-5]